MGTVQAEHALFVQILEVGFVEKVEVLRNDGLVQCGKQEIDLVDNRRRSGYVQLSCKSARVIGRTSMLANLNVMTGT